MYLGRLVENAGVQPAASAPWHPDSQLSLGASRADPASGWLRRHLRRSPVGRGPPTGCRFHTRCPFAVPERTSASRARRPRLAVSSWPVIARANCATLSQDAQ